MLSDELQSREASPFPAFLMLLFYNWVARTALKLWSLQDRNLPVERGRNTMEDDIMSRDCWVERLDLFRTVVSHYLDLMRQRAQRRRKMASRGHLNVDTSRPQLLDIWPSVQSFIIPSLNLLSLVLVRLHIGESVRRLKVCTVLPWRWNP